MFSSLLRSRKDDRPETAPLLAAFNRRLRYTHADGDDNNEDAYQANYDQRDDDYEEEDRGGRDGPLLPVFSSEFLGTMLLI